MLQSGILEEDLKLAPSRTKIVSKVIYSQGKYIKAFVEGSLDDGKLSIKMTGISEDSEIIVIEEELNNLLLIGICKLIYIQEVLPLAMPLRLIRTFEEFARICILPYILFTNNSGVEGSQMSESAHEGGSEYNKIQFQSLSPNQRQIELWGRAPGLFDSETTLEFLEN